MEKKGNRLDVFITSLGIIFGLLSCVVGYHIGANSQDKAWRAVVKDFANMHGMPAFAESGTPKDLALILDGCSVAIWAASSSNTYNIHSSMFGSQTKSAIFNSLDSNRQKAKSEQKGK